MGYADAIGAALTTMNYYAGIRSLAKGQTRESSRTRANTLPEGASEDTGWLITLSDLTLLLICFLAVWYVKSQTSPRPRAVESAAQSAQTAGATDDVDAQDADWRTLRQELEKFIGAAGMSRDVTIAAAPNEILLSFKDAVPFASGKADLRPKALPVLEKVAAVAVSRPTMQVGISGHTDDRPIATAAYPSNWELSSARASRVARYLIERGVHPARISVQGFAYHRPRVPNENRSSRAANRRVEIRLMRGGETPVAASSEAG